MYPYLKLKAIVLVPLLLGLFATFVQILIFGYQGEFWSEQVIYSINDGWCSSPDGIGSHCFGDFGFPFNSVNDEILYREKNNLLQINPPMIFVFKLLRLFPYNVALFLFLFGSTVAVCYPFLCRASSLSLPDKLIWSLVSGLSSIGYLAAFDRGNNVVFVVPLLFAYIVFVHRARWLLAVLMIVLIATIKFWAVLLVVGIIAKRRYRHAGAALFLSGLVNFLPIVILHLLGQPGGLGLKIRLTAKAIFDNDFANLVSVHAISFWALINRTGCIVQNNGPCEMTRILQSQSSAMNNFVKFLIVVFCLLVVFVLMRLRDIPSFVWMTAIVGLPVVAVPEAAIYNASSVIAGLAAILALAVGEKQDSNQTLSRSWQILVSLPIVSSLVSFSLVDNIDQSSSTLINGVNVFRSYWFVIPSAWIVFYIGVIILASRQLCIKKIGICDVIGSPRNMK